MEIDMANVPARKAPKRGANAEVLVQTKAKADTAPKTTRMRKVKSKPMSAAAEKKGTTMNDTVKQVEETVKKATAQAGEKATEMFNDASTRAKSAMEKAVTFSKDAVEFNKANLEAFVESGKLAAKGAQSAAQNAADFGRKNFEATTAMIKEAAAVKSPTDLLKVQSDFARGQLDRFVAEVSKSSEFTLKLAGEVFQPIQSRYSAAADAIKTRLAA